MVRAASLRLRWASWCRRLEGLDQVARCAWGEYDALLSEADELRLSAWLDLNEVRLEVPPELAAIRAGEGALRWRPPP